MEVKVFGTFTRCSTFSGFNFNWQSYEKAAKIPNNAPVFFSTKHFSLHNHKLGPKKRPDYLAVC